MTLEKTKDGSGFTVKPDTYNFEMHKMSGGLGDRTRTAIRNVETAIAHGIAGEGQEYTINFSGKIDF